MYSRSNPRRRHGAEFKAAIVAACDEPGASVAAMAQAHGLNANLVHQWRRGRGRGASGTAAAATVTAPALEASSVTIAAPVFIPVELPAPTPAPAAVSAPAPAPAPDVPQEIHIELRRGAVTVNVRWPMPAAAQFAAWLREILR